MNTKPKMRTCKCGCRKKFMPRNSLQVAATPECALVIARKRREKDEAQAKKVERQATREAKEKIKSRRDWMNEAQAAVNAYVRARDEGKPCISCGRHHQGQNHAGHYLSRGAHPELALDTRNLNLQCQPCNTHLSGNQINYRKGLIQRYGPELVEWLEGPHEPKRYTIDDLKRIRDEYRAKLKEILRVRSGSIS